MSVVELTVFVGELILSQSMVFPHLVVGYGGDFYCEICWELLLLDDVWCEAVLRSAVAE